MWRVIATYPLAHTARITAIATTQPGSRSARSSHRRSGRPAATVSGATPASTKNSTAGTPSRSRASARDTLPGLVPATCVLDIQPPGSLSLGRRSFTCGGKARRCRRWPGSGRSARAGPDRAARLPAPPPIRPGPGTGPAGKPRPAPSSQPGQHPVADVEGAGRVQHRARPDQRREPPVRIRRDPSRRLPRQAAASPRQVSGPRKAGRHVLRGRAGQEQQPLRHPQTSSGSPAT